MRYKIVFSAISIIAILFSSGCSSFVTDEESDSLSLKYQVGSYQLLQDIERNGVTLSRGTIVKLTVVTGDEWIKFYAYDVKEQLLSSNRLILLYLFEDDFPDEEYNRELLEKELGKLIRLADSGQVSGSGAKKSRNKR